LTIDEAGAYSSIGQNRLRAIIEENPTYDWILHKGKHILIKRPLFEQWLMEVKYVE